MMQNVLPYLNWHIHVYINFNHRCIFIYKFKVVQWNSILCFVVVFNLLVFSFPAKDTDIIDEAIYYFKANVFFKNYEIKVS